MRLCVIIYNIIRKEVINMFAKTVCKPGSYLCVVPVGLLATLQYSSRGVLEKITIGFEENPKPLSKDILDTIKSNKLVPLSIPITGGTTWISGVFYTDKEFYDEGTLPGCIENSILSDIKQNPRGYTFYAGHVDSLAASFTAIMTTRNWLNMSKFKTLPGYIIPYNLSEESFCKMINTNRFPFKFPLISGYMIWEGSEYTYYPIMLSQFIAHRVVKSMDEYGYITGNILNKESLIALNTKYSDVIYYNIQASSNVVCTSKGKIVYSKSTDNKSRDKRSNKLVCSICGKEYTAPTSGKVQCDDVHCLSRSYPDICHMLRVLKLPELSYDKYLKYVKQGDITYILDVLLLPEYSNLDIEATMSTLLRAITPLEVCRDDSVFTLVADRCSSSAKTLMYYIEHLDRLHTEIGLSSGQARRWIEWLSDGYNSVLVKTLLEYSNIHIIDNKQKFDGAPIFRGKQIAITGKFRHGGLDEVISILRSYSADVVTDVSNSTDCLIIGEFKENIDGKSVQYAKSAGIPIFDEDDFFDKYDIDSDLAENLL